MSFLRTQEKLSWAFISGVRSTVLKNDNYGLSCVIYPRATRLEAVAASAGPYATGLKILFPAPPC
ncbi:hypothetical protein KPHES18084_07870 [Corynebacterium ulcerans]|nr:Hypothetical protein CUL131002_0816 [Corynebacterium ulcerans]BDV25645.1 hypothetical protein CULTSU28_08930 [Corynebacterium ulcerans]